jgi:plastocyanin
MRRLSVPVFTIAAALAFGACSSGSSAAPSSAASSAPSVAAASAPAAGGAAVTVKGFAFTPPTISAKVGETITWTNQDAASHTVTLDDKSVDSGNIATNATYSHAFTAAGSFPYHCQIHPQMKGTITITG